MSTLLLDYVHKGGAVNGLIFCVCFVVAYGVIDKILEYHAFARRLAGADGRAAADAVASEGWLRRALCSGVPEGVTPTEERCRNRLRELVLEHAPRLENGLDTIAAWVSIAPLLGLLGTVVGMIQTFGIITEFGVGNPSLLSEGISVALLTTESGLIVAFPGLLAHNLLRERKDDLVEKLVAEGERVIGSMQAEGCHVE